MRAFSRPSAPGATALTIDTHKRVDRIAHVCEYSSHALHTAARKGNQMNEHTEQHDGAERAARSARLRRVFAVLMYRQGLDGKSCQWLIDAVDRQHARNIAAFGWTDADAMRASAFADVASAPVPIGDATESELAELREGA